MIIWLDFYGLREFLTAFNEQSSGAKLDVQPNTYIASS